jgi:hypothetical protein
MLDGGEIDGRRRLVPNSSSGSPPVAIQPNPIPSPNFAVVILPHGPSPPHPTLQQQQPLPTNQQDKNKQILSSCIY